MCVSTLLLLASSGVGNRILEGCKDACQYAIDKLQGTFNSVTNWLPLLLIATGLLAYFALARRRKAEAVVYDGPPSSISGRSRQSSLLVSPCSVSRWRNSQRQNPLPRLLVLAGSRFRLLSISHGKRSVGENCLLIWRSSFWPHVFLLSS